MKVKSRRLSGILRRVRARGLRYWLTSLAILVVTMWAQPFLDERLNVQDVKAGLFRTLSTSATNPAIARHVKLVLIGDDEYWDGDALYRRGPTDRCDAQLYHRLPTNRCYVAKLIRAAADADASVVAIDFDMRLPHPAEAAVPGHYDTIDPPYREETDELMRAIGEIANGRPVILAKSMRGPIGGPFDLTSDAFQLYGICAGLRPDGSWENPGTPEFPLTPAARRNIRCGYIALMTDKRQVPPPAVLNGNPARLDSFPLAIVRARDPSAVNRFEAGHYYASYIQNSEIRDPRIVLSSRQLLHDAVRARSVLQGFPVIIGANWHQRAKGEGGTVDLHRTPIGNVIGPLIHENLAEAVLSNRTYPALSEDGLLIIEIVLGLAAAVLFALLGSWRVAAAVLAVAMIVVLGLQWVFLQLFGAFIDLFAPVLGLGIHAVADGLFASEE